ncbi:hypothetical protein HBJ16_002256 [Pseudomonas sp. CES]|nr:hypothetical protein HBJ16_002256 [Pseudomonas sp. CES]
MDHLIHLDQEQLFAGLLALAGVLGVGEGHLLHQVSWRLRSGVLPESHHPMGADWIFSGFRIESRRDS